MSEKSIKPDCDGPEDVGVDDEDSVENEGVIDNAEEVDQVFNFLLNRDGSLDDPDNAARSLEAVEGLVQGTDVIRCGSCSNFLPAGAVGGAGSNISVVRESQDMNKSGSVEYRYKILVEGEGGEGSVEEGIGNEIIKEGGEYFYKIKVGGERDATVAGVGSGNSDCQDHEVVEEDGELFYKIRLDVKPGTEEADGCSGEEAGAREGGKHVYKIRYEYEGDEAEDSNMEVGEMMRMVGELGGEVGEKRVIRDGQEYIYEIRREGVEFSDDETVVGDGAYGHIMGELIEGADTIVSEGGDVVYKVQTAVRERTDEVDTVWESLPLEGADASVLSEHCTEGGVSEQILTDGDLLGEDGQCVYQVRMDGTDTGFDDIMDEDMLSRIVAGECRDGEEIISNEGGITVVRGSREGREYTYTIRQSREQEVSEESDAEFISRLGVSGELSYIQHDIGDGDEGERIIEDISMAGGVREKVFRDDGTYYYIIRVGRKGSGSTEGGSEIIIHDREVDCSDDDRMPELGDSLKGVVREKVFREDGSYYYIIRAGKEGSGSVDEGSEIIVQDVEGEHVVLEPIVGLGADDCLASDSVEGGECEKIFREDGSYYYIIRGRRVGSSSMDGEGECSVDEPIIVEGDEDVLSAHSMEGGVKEKVFREDGSYYYIIRGRRKGLGSMTGERECAEDENILDSSGEGVREKVFREDGTYYYIIRRRRGRAGSMDGNGTGGEDETIIVEGDEEALSGVEGVPEKVFREDGTYYYIIRRRRGRQGSIDGDEGCPEDETVFVEGDEEALVGDEGVPEKVFREDGTYYYIIRRRRRRHGSIDGDAGCPEDETIIVDGDEEALAREEGIPEKVFREDGTYYYIIRRRRGRQGSIDGEEACPEDETVIVEGDEEALAGEEGVPEKVFREDGTYYYIIRRRRARQDSIDGGEGCPEDETVIVEGDEEALAGEEGVPEKVFREDGTCYYIIRRRRGRQGSIDGEEALRSPEDETVIVEGDEEALAGEEGVPEKVFREDGTYYYIIRRRRGRHGSIDGEEACPEDETVIVEGDEEALVGLEGVPEKVFREDGTYYYIIRRRRGRQGSIDGEAGCPADETVIVEGDEEVLDGVEGVPEKVFREDGTYYYIIRRRRGRQGSIDGEEGCPEDDTVIVEGEEGVPEKVFREDGTYYYIIRRRRGRQGSIDEKGDKTIIGLGDEDVDGDERGGSGSLDGDGECAEDEPLIGECAEDKPVVDIECAEDECVEDERVSGIGDDDNVGKDSAEEGVQEKVFREDGTYYFVIRGRQKRAGSMTGAEECVEDADGGCAKEPVIGIGDDDSLCEDSRKVGCAEDDDGECAEDEPIFGIGEEDYLGEDSTEEGVREKVFRKDGTYYFVIRGRRKRMGSMTLDEERAEDDDGECAEDESVIGIGDDDNLCEGVREKVFREDGTYYFIIRGRRKGTGSMTGEEEEGVREKVFRDDGTFYYIIRGKRAGSGVMDDCSGTIVHDGESEQRILGDGETEADEACGGGEHGEHSLLAGDSSQLGGGEYAYKICYDEQTMGDDDLVGIISGRDADRTDGMIADDKVHGDDGEAHSEDIPIEEMLICEMNSDAVRSCREAERVLGSERVARNALCGGAWGEPCGVVDDTNENGEEEPPDDDRDSGTTEEMERLDQNLIEDNELHHANTLEEKPKKYFGGLGYLLTRFKGTDNQKIPLIPKERTTKCFCGRSLAFLVIVSGFLFGYDTGVVSGSMLLIRPYFKLNVIWTQLIVSATVATGAAVAGLAEFVADIVGRKIIILLGAIIFTSGAVIMGIANSTLMVISGRIVIGLAMGLSTVVVRLYVKESAHISNKKWLIAMLNMFFTVGNLVANFLCMVLSYIGIYVGDDTMWKYVLGFGLVPAVLQFIAMFILPESPRWLLEEEDPEQARENLITLRGTDEIEAELNQMRLDVEKEKREAEKDSSDDDDSPWGVFEDVIDELDDDVEDTFDTQNENKPNQTSNDNSTSPVGNKSGDADGKGGAGNGENPNRNEGELKSGHGDGSGENGSSNNSITGKQNSSSGNSDQSGNNQPHNISDNSSSTGSNNPSGTGTYSGTGDNNENNGTKCSSGQDNGRNSTDPHDTRGGSNKNSSTQKDNGNSTDTGSNSQNNGGNSSAKQSRDGNSTGPQGTGDGSNNPSSTGKDNDNSTDAGANSQNNGTDSSANQSSGGNSTGPQGTSNGNSATDPNSVATQNHNSNGKNSGNSTGANDKNNATTNSSSDNGDNSTGPQGTGNSPNSTENGNSTGVKGNNGSETSAGTRNQSGTGPDGQSSTNDGTGANNSPSNRGNNGNSTGAKGNNGSGNSSGTSNPNGTGPDGQNNTNDGTGANNTPTNGAKNGKNNPGKQNSNGGKKKSNPNSKAGKSAVGANKSEYTPLEGSAKPAPGAPVIVRIWRKPKVRRPFLNVLFLFLFQQLSGISVLILYGGSIIFLAGMSTTMSLGLLNLPNGLYVIATYISTKKDTLEDNRKLLLMVSFFGVFMGMCFIATGFQLQESYITPVNYIEDLSNFQLNVSVYPYCNHSYYSSCELCVRNGFCGFCHPVGNWLNGSCLPLNVNNTQRSVVGRCNMSHYPGSEYEFVDAAGGCHNFSWFVVVGMVVFVLFYAPGLGQVTHSEDSERCPAWARKTSNSIARSVNWVANLLISMSFLLLVEGITTYGTFWMFSGFCLFAFVYVTKYLADDD